MIIIAIANQDNILLVEVLKSSVILQSYIRSCSITTQNFHNDIFSPIVLVYFMNAPNSVIFDSYAESQRGVNACRGLL